MLRLVDRPVAAGGSALAAVLGEALALVRFDGSGRPARVDRYPYPGGGRAELLPGEAVNVADLEGVLRRQEPGFEAATIRVRPSRSRVFAWPSTRCRTGPDTSCSGA